MTRIINPVLNKRDFFSSTSKRCQQVIAPIEDLRDIGVYLTTPLIDSFILEPAFALDASIHLLNAVASFTKALYLWTMEAPSCEIHEQIEDSSDYLISSLSAILAQTLNTILSTLALITRPIATVVDAIYDIEEYRNFKV